MKLVRIGVVSFTVLGMMSSAQAYSGPEITFEQVLEDPDDKTLNMNYAKQQEKIGDVVSALGAVERLMFNNADDDSLRLYYVSLLLKADDLQAAKRELIILEQRELSSSEQAKNQSYRRQAGMGEMSKPSSKASKLRGMVAVGARYEDSAGEALTDGATALTTSPADVAVFAQGALQFKMPFQDNSNTALRGGVNGQTMRHETFSGVDYDSFGANLGLSGGSEAFTWHLDGVYQKVYVDNQEYLSQAGPKLQLVTNLSPDTKLIGTASYYDQDFDDLRSTVGENGRSGEKISGSVGIRHKIGETSAVGITVGYTDKDASTAIYAYDGLFGNAEMRHGFVNGSYFRGVASYQDLSFKGGSGRNDDRLSGGLTLGAPFATIAEAMGSNASPFAEKVSVEGTVRYTERNSDFTGLDFDSLGAEMRLVWNF